MILHINPTVLIQTSFEKHAPLINLNNKNFEFSIGLFGLNNTIYPIDPSIYNLQIIHNKIEYRNIDGFLNFTSTTYQLSYHICNKSDFPISKTLVYNNMICLDNNNFELEGYFTDNGNFSTLNIYLYPCQNGTSNTVCQSQETIEKEIAGGKAFNVLYGGYFINNNDFSNPIKYLLQLDFVGLDLRFLKIMGIYLKKTIFLDDYEYIFSNPIETDTYTNGNIENEFAQNSNDNKNCLCLISFYSSQEIQQNSRTYQKLSN